MLKYKFARPFSDTINGVSSVSLLLTFVKIVTTLIGIITTRILCSVLSTTDYGTYAQVLLIVTTISSITILGMSDGINFFYNKYRNERLGDDYIATIFGLQLFASLVALIIVFLSANSLAIYFNNIELEKLLLFAGVIPFLNNIISMLQVLFISIGKAKHLASRNLLLSLSNLVFFSVGVVLTRKISIVLMITVILCLVQILYFIIVLKSNGVLINLRKVKLHIVPVILKYCVPMSMFILLNTFSRDIDKFIITSFTNTETLAMYTNASKILPFDLVVTSYITVLLPYITSKISNKEFKQVEFVYKNFLMLSFAVTCGLAAGVIPLSIETITLLYTQRYVSAYPIFIIYIFIDIFRFMSIPLVLSSSGETRKLMGISLGSLLFNGVLSLVFYKLFGITGPAIASLISLLLTGIVIVFYSSKSINTRFFNLINIREMFVISIFIIFACTVEYIIRLFVNSITNNYLIVLLLSYGGYIIIVSLLLKKKILDYIIKLNRVGKEIG